MSWRYLTQVCERRGVISARGTSLWEPVSGHIHQQETAADAGGGMTRPFAHGQRCGEVTPVRERTGGGGAQGSVCEPASLLTSHHLNHGFTLAPPPLHSTTSPSQSPDPSGRLALTGRSCALALRPTALFDFARPVHLCEEGAGWVGGGSKSLFQASEGPDFCGRAVRSPFLPRQATGKWQHLTRATRLCDGEYVLSSSKLVAAE